MSLRGTKQSDAIQDVLVRFAIASCLAKAWLLFDSMLKRHPVVPL